MTAPRLRALALLSITLLHGWSLWRVQHPVAAVPAAEEPVLPLRAAA